MPGSVVPRRGCVLGVLDERVTTGAWVPSMLLNGLRNLTFGTSWAKKKKKQTVGML